MILSQQVLSPCDFLHVIAFFSHVILSQFIYFTRDSLMIYLFLKWFVHGLVWFLHDSFCVSFFTCDSFVIHFLTCESVYNSFTQFIYHSTTSSWFIFHLWVFMILFLHAIHWFSHVTHYLFLSLHIIFYTHLIFCNQQQGGMMKWRKFYIYIYINSIKFWYYTYTKFWCYFFL